MKHILFIIMFVCLFASSATAQDQAIDKAEDMSGLQAYPTFPGSFQKYVASYLKGLSFKTSQKVYVTFVIEKDGSVTNPEFSEGTETKMKKKIVQAFKECTGWTPGIKNGVPVRVKYSLPIMIKGRK